MVLLREVVHIISAAMILVVGCRMAAVELGVHRHHKTNLNHDLLVGFISAFASTCCGEEGACWAYLLLFYHGI